MHASVFTIPKARVVVNKYFCYKGIVFYMFMCYKNSRTAKKGGAGMGDKEKNVFRRGVMSLVILGLLKREDMYGYQLVQETARLSEGKLTTQEGSLYPVLYRLQEEGLISDKRVQVGKRMTRIYYHLEEAGVQRLEELIREYRETTQAVYRIANIEGGADGESI